jgi:hypothetical protein
LAIADIPRLTPLSDLEALGERFQRDVALDQREGALATNLGIPTLNPLDTSHLPSCD